MSCNLVDSCMCIYFVESIKLTEDVAVSKQDKKEQIQKFNWLQQIFLKLNLKANFFTPDLSSAGIIKE